MADFGRIVLSGNDDRLGSMRHRGVQPAYLEGNERIRGHVEVQHLVVHWPVEEIMRLIHKDAVRQSCLTTKGAEHLQKGQNVIEALHQRHLREVDDYARPRVAEYPLKVSEVRLALFRENHDSWQGFQGRVIPFGIDNANAILLQYKLFADQSCEP
jgi:hypothetical protein